MPLISYVYLGGLQTEEVSARVNFAIINATVSLYSIECTHVGPLLSSLVHVPAPVTVPAALSPDAAKCPNQQRQKQINTHAMHTQLLEKVD